ncbi:MAG: zinc ribbon domain-containing protein [Actinobacteria bacterium]|nr:zinc ribbon domain-containing protein [Actinomycetota bacterium]
MPIYEYRRKDGSTFEVIQKFSDDPLTADPETGEPVERVYTAPAIHFKGSGFHNTDYSSSRRPKAGGGGESSSGGSSGGDSGGSSAGESTSSSASSSSSNESSPKPSTGSATSD